MASTNGTSNHGTNHTKPLFSFGVIADVQHAENPNGYSFRGIPRYYQNSIKVLQNAVDSWNKNPNLSFVLNFGDIVDGLCPKQDSLRTVRKVIDEFNKFQGGPVHHMIGNHCLYNLPRDQLLPLLNLPHAYYHFTPGPTFRIVVLDSFDVSAFGWPSDHPNTKSAIETLRAKNPNKDKNSPNGLTGLDRRFVMFNGGFGEEQLKWLDGVLQESTENEQNVIICCHQPLDWKASSYEALPWDYDEAMDVVRRYRCVKACFAGHEHMGGYSVDECGVHHRVLQAALECPPGSNAFGYVDVYKDRLVLVGTDRMNSTEMIFK